MDDLGNFCSHGAVFREGDKSPWLGISVIRCPGCGFDNQFEGRVGDWVIGEISCVASCADGVEDQVCSPVVGVGLFGGRLCRNFIGSQVGCASEMVSDGSRSGSVKRVERS